jgi:phosphoribosylformylglycinamidine synthase subunit PurSL
MKLGVFASGDGSNFEALAQSFSIAFLVCDREEAGVLQRAERLGVKTYLIPRQPGEKREGHEERIWSAIRSENFDLLCLAGFRRLLSANFLAHFPQGAVVNIHPSLLPLHPGLTGYEETFNSNAPVGGVTVHEVDAGLDTGRILAQATFQREASDTLATFKLRGLAVEHELYPKVVQDILSQPYVHRLEVLPAAKELLQNPQQLSGRVLWVQTTGPCAQLKRIASDMLVDPVSERLFTTASLEYERHLAYLGYEMPCSERGFHPGVTDNAGSATREAWELHPWQESGLTQVRSGETWRGVGAMPVANPLLQWERTTPNAFADVQWRSVKAETLPVRTIELPSDEADLLKMNNQNWWALTLPELRLVQEFFQTRGTAPTDVEMEIIAQTWSEHCKHKIFRANITYTDADSGETRQVKSLFKTYIKGVTDQVRRERNLNWLISVFDDNAGIVRWDNQVDLAIKVETHNSPSALDPYGGALTGILGVNRDILGVGMGARPIANTNVFCLAPADLDQRMGEAWPKTVLPPAQIRTGVHAGVKDGGNKSGIPTVNGAFHYDVNFAGKPLVFCGTLGVLPQKVNNRPSWEKPVSPRDHVVMVGGRIGKDGLHGATFSSMEWKEGTPASVVQIGDPLTQKRVTDFMLEARDLGLYSGLTDNGAGGLSSSIGEMALITGGADIDLARAPVKYPGLSAWELMVSESQERMTVAVPPAQLETFMHLAQLRGVEAANLGTFTSTGELHVRFDGASAARLPLNFLHEGLPPMELKAKWGSEFQWQDWCERPELQRSLPAAPDAESITTALMTMLSHANIRSHETWVRQYDHEVQAASVAKPFSTQGAPSDAGVIAMGPHGGEASSGVVVGCGLAPQISRFDPYVMGVWAVDEAVRNTVCAGGDPERMALVDNFCWPDPVISEKNPEGDVKLGMLVRTCEGMADTSLAYGLPLVSGKDSMKNDAHVVSRNKPVKISALPTLLMTCMAHHPDVSRAIPSAPQEAGLVVVLLSPIKDLSAVTLSQSFHVMTNAPMAGDLKQRAIFYKTVHQAMSLNLICSAHDVGEGGVLTAMAETSIGKVGFTTDIIGDWGTLFGEGPGQIIVTCRETDMTTITTLFPTQHARRIGVTTQENGLVMSQYNLKLKASDIRAAYQEAT